MNRQLITTADGSHSIYLSEFDEHYHSVHGAIQESEHVFIRAGFDFVSSGQNPLNLLEIGFGTGLNALLTYLNHQKNPERTVNYTAIEAFPLETAIASQLNYPELLNSEAATEVFNLLHQSEWNQAVSISSHFTLTKLETTIQAYHPSNKFHLIYFDAFAPTAQPELWTADVFSKIFDSLKKGGILTTYCAKGIVKRTLKEVGFKVESLQGPIGKREMTRALKI